MRSVLVWVAQLKEGEESLCVHDAAFRPDGEVLAIAAGNTVQVYSADGKLVQSLKGHKDTVYSVSWARDGESFASGGADKQVIVWGGTPFEGKLKYPHSESIQRVAYNPTSPLVLSCTNIDFGLWSPDYKKSVFKEKVASRCCSCSWTNDGQYFAIGHHNGAITFWTKGGVMVKEIAKSRGFPVWSISWNPSREDKLDILTVCDWGQKLSYFLLNSKQVGKDRTLNYDPTCVAHFPSGGFSVVTGTNRKVNVYSREGVLLGVVSDMEAWPWTCSIRPGKNINQVIVGCQDGTVALYQLTFNTVHGLFKERYAFREQMTEVVVQHLTSDETARIKCRDLVKKIAVYNNRLAIQLPEKIVVYEIPSNDPEDMQYKVKSKFEHKEDCSLLVVCSSHIILCQERTLQCLTMSGDKEREWMLDCQIRYIKVVSGPVGMESILVGLRNGQISRIFVNNPFPNLLLKQQVAIRCLDLSLSRTKLAVVDENSILMVYDLNTKQLLYQEPNATSVAWNSQYEDMLCFSGNGFLNIKTSNFPIHQLKHQGFVVGFIGSKIFSLNYFSMTHVDVPQSVSMVQYLERKNYSEAYKIACLGVTANDWRILAMEALEGMDFETAKKAFIRVREIGYLELIHNIEERKKQGESNNQIFLADIYAYQGKFQDAAELYKKSKADGKAVEMYTDLREFDLAKKSMTSADQGVKDLITKQADWAMNTNDKNTACEMYIAAGEYAKAVEIMGENGWVDRLSALVHDISKTEVEVLNRCAHFFKVLAQPLAAAQVYEKLGDTAGLIALYVECKQWQMAFELAKQHNQYTTEVYLPYAHWLMENDRFNEAHIAMCTAGKEQEALQLLEELANNAINERRYNDASYYYWLLAKSCQEATQRIPTDSEDSKRHDADELTQKFHCSLDLADLYYVFHGIHCFIEQPFTSFMPEALLNMARYLILRTLKNTPRGISRASILFTLSKQSRNLGAYKLARYAYDKLQGLRVPSNLQDAVDIGSLTIRSKPFEDKDDLLPMCYRCSTMNPLINSLGNSCVNCKQPFELSFVSYEALPVVGFVLEDGISDEEALKLIKKDPPRRKASSRWKETDEGTTQTLRMDDAPPETDEVVEDPFHASTYEHSDEFVAVVCGRRALESLHRLEVIVKKWGAPIGNQYYKSVMPDVNITVCPSCNKMFHADDFEVQVLSKGHCPFCRNKAQSF